MHGYSSSFTNKKRETSVRKERKDDKDEEKS